GFAEIGIYLGSKLLRWEKFGSVPAGEKNVEMACRIVAIGSEIERAVGSDGRIEVVVVVLIDRIWKRSGFSPCARIAFRNPDAEDSALLLNRPDRGEIKFCTVAAETGRDIEGLAGEGKRQRRIPMAVFEVADANHGETRCGGVRRHEREVRDATVQAENAGGFMKVGRDEIGREERWLRHVLAVVIRRAWSLRKCGAWGSNGEKRQSAESATKIVRHRKLLQRHDRGQIVGALDGGVRKMSTQP